MATRDADRRVLRVERAEVANRPDALVARIAGEQDGVVSRAQLRACGVSRRGVTTRVANGRLHRLHRGVYAVGHAGIALRGRLRAAVLACR